MKPRSKTLETTETGTTRSRTAFGEKKPVKQKSDVSVTKAAETQVASTRITSKSSSAGTKISGDEISRRAHEIWLREGQPQGRDREHWFRAEHELQKERRG